MEIEQMDRIYLKVRRIQGWLPPHACRLIAILDAVQKGEGIRGNLFEIGVWHGKSAIPLASLLADEESLGVCDIFDDTDANGNSLKLRRLQENMSRFFADTSFLRVYPRSSRELSRDDVSADCRLIHIDGAHDSLNVYEDLVLAESCVHEQGAIVMDDAFQAMWPGVSDGIYRFMYERPDQLVPLVFGFRKLVLVRSSAVAHYSEHFADSRVLKERFSGGGPYLYRRETLLGHPVHVYFERVSVQAAFCPELVKVAATQFPWLRNPVTRRVNRWLRKLLGR